MLANSHPRARCTPGAARGFINQGGGRLEMTKREAKREVAIAVAAWMAGTSPHDDLGFICETEADEQRIDDAWNELQLRLFKKA